MWSIYPEWTTATSWWMQKSSEILSSRNHKLPTFPSNTIWDDMTDKNVDNDCQTHVGNLSSLRCWRIATDFKSTTPPKFNSSPLKNRGLEDDPFLLGFGHFLGENSLKKTSGGYSCFWKLVTRFPISSGAPGPSICFHSHWDTILNQSPHGLGRDFSLSFPVVLGGWKGQGSHFWSVLKFVSCNVWNLWQISVELRGFQFLGT